MILHVHRNFRNSEIVATEAVKALVLGLDALERPQGTQGLFITPPPNHRKTPGHRPIESARLTRNNDSDEAAVGR